MYIERDLAADLDKFLGRREYLSIEGPRQAGKTTLLKELQGGLETQGKRVKFLTFEKRKEAALFDQIDDFKDSYRSNDVIIIDEFQYAREGGQKLKYLYDTTKLKIIVSGSSSLELRFQTGRYMVGRLLSFTLLPFSFREYLKSYDMTLFGILSDRIPDPFRLNMKKLPGDEINGRLREAFEKFTIYGGYPEVVTSSEASKRKILEGIVENYLLKDIRVLLQMATEEELLKLSRFLSTQTGNLVDYRELSSSSTLPYNNLLKHLNVLQKTYVLNLLRPFFTNKRTELIKNPRAYFVDTGFRNHLISDFRPISVRTDAGGLIENVVYCSLIKRGYQNSINFWRTKSRAEVDFVILKDGERLPIEVKYSRKPAPGKSLYSFLEKFSPSNAFILTAGYSAETRIKGCRVRFIPCFYF